jgi:hypothetical protein
MTAGLVATTAAQLRSGQRLRLTPVERIGTTVVLALLGVAVIGIGRYGLRKGAAMLPDTVNPDQIPHRVAVLRRGAIACVVAGLCVLAAAVLVGLF